MLGSLNLIVLFGVFLTVSSADVRFNILGCRSKKGDTITEADYSGLKINAITKGDKVAGYVAGTFDFKSTFLDKSYKVYYSFKQYDESIREYVETEDLPKWGKVDVCTFFDKVYRKYLLPLTNKHNDYPVHTESVCPIEARTYHVGKVESISELYKPSEMEPGKYRIFFEFQKDGKSVGGVLFVYEVIEH